MVIHKMLDVAKILSLRVSCAKVFVSFVVPGWDPYTGLGTPNFGVLAELALNPSFFNFPEKDQ